MTIRINLQAELEERGIAVPDSKYPEIYEAFEAEFSEFIDRNARRIVSGGTAQDSILDALNMAESFVNGFEDCELQEGIPELLASIRAAKSKAESLAYAVRTIAASPLYGEKIECFNLKTEAIEAGEYDELEDQYEPSADTESTALRECVELARAVLDENEPIT